MCRGGRVKMKVRVGDGKGNRFTVTLPVLPNKKENVTLEAMQWINVENEEEKWSIWVRVGIGYVLARMLEDTMKRKKKKTKKGEVILELTSMVIESLKKGERLFEIKESSWTKEIKNLVRSKWGWKGTFGVREDNAASRENERCVVILFDPARITEIVRHK